MSSAADRSNMQTLGTQNSAAGSWVAGTFGKEHHNEKGRVCRERFFGTVIGNGGDKEGDIKVAFDDGTEQSCSEKSLLRETGSRQRQYAAPLQV
jgi:hypothetical protein